MKCANCQAELSPGEMFCGECGLPVQAVATSPSTATSASARACPRCGSAVDAGKRFCGTCGYDLMAATPQPQTTRPAAPGMGQVFAGTPPRSSRLALVVGLAILAAVFLLGGVGLVLWIGWGRGQEANQNTAQRATTGTPANVNSRGMKVSISGSWNCEHRSSPTAEPERALLVLAQNGSSVTATVTEVKESGYSSPEQGNLIGTFDGQKVTLRSPGMTEELQLVLSPDGSSMQGGVGQGSDKETVICSR